MIILFMIIYIIIYIWVCSVLFLSHQLMVKRITQNMPCNKATRVNITSAVYIYSFHFFFIISLGQGGWLY